LAGSLPFSLLSDGAVSRLLQEQLRLAKKIKASLFIAHNLAALPVAARAANYHGVKYAIDAEDYHRGEMPHENSRDAMLKKKVEDRYLPGAAYLTAASPLITQQYASHYPAKRVITINNVFSVTYQQSLDARNNRQGLKLFWFSQTVGLDRGLEEVIQAMGLLQKKDVQLTLLGHCTDQQRVHFIDLGRQQGLAEGQIIFLPTVPPEEVFTISRSHDIGLALEVPHCTNRDICLTNKIFTYLIAGNAIIASETRAQKLFMDTYPGVGLSFPVRDVDRLAEHILFFYQNREALEEYRRNAWRLAKEELNWEKEKCRFLDVVQATLDDPAS
jgi:glycosyltransferase involved in cell wall biosynthesis